MVCCLTASNHYLNQCWLIFSEVLWHSLEGNLTVIAQNIYPWYAFENYKCKNRAASPRGQRVVAALHWAAVGLTYSTKCLFYLVTQFLRRLLKLIDIYLWRKGALRTKTKRKPQNRGAYLPTSLKGYPSRAWCLGCCAILDIRPKRLLNSNLSKFVSVGQSFWKFVQSTAI